MLRVQNYLRSNIYDTDFFPPLNCDLVEHLLMGQQLLHLALMTFHFVTKVPQKRRQQNNYMSQTTLPWNREEAIKDTEIS